MSRYSPRLICLLIVPSVLRSQEIELRSGDKSERVAITKVGGYEFSAQFMAEPSEQDTAKIVLSVKHGSFNHTLIDCQREKHLNYQILRRYTDKGPFLRLFYTTKKENSGFQWYVDDSIDVILPKQNTILAQFTLAKVGVEDAVAKITAWTKDNPAGYRRLEETPPPGIAQLQIKAATLAEAAELTRRAALEAQGRARGAETALGTARDELQRKEKALADSGGKDEREKLAVEEARRKETQATHEKTVSALDADNARLRAEMALNDAKATASEYEALKLLSSARDVEVRAEAARAKAEESNSALWVALVGALATAIASVIAYLLNRPMLRLEMEKCRAETNKLKVETDCLTQRAMAGASSGRPGGAGPVEKPGGCASP